jgi:hypothetical protein
MRRLAAVGCFVLIGAALVGCSQKYRPVEVGECLPDGVDVVGIREADPKRVPCSEEHRYEVYAVTRIDPGPDRPGEDWPGEAAVDAAADEACQEQLADGAGIDRNDPPSGVRILRVQPTEDSWTNDHDRAVECLLHLDPPRAGRLAGGKASQG